MRARESERGRTRERKQERGRKMREEKGGDREGGDRKGQRKSIEVSQMLQRENGEEIGRVRGRERQHVAMNI